MIYSNNGAGACDSRYLIAKTKLDFICTQIIRREITHNKAREEYQAVENEYKQYCPDNAELFAMIYKSRIERLCEQFPQRSD